MNINNIAIVRITNVIYFDYLIRLLRNILRSCKILISSVIIHLLHVLGVISLLEDNYYQMLNI